MRTTIDRLGRVVIPKKAREAAHLQPGAELEVRVLDGVVHLEPACGEFELVKKAGFHVLQPKAELPALSESQVRETLRDVRDSRAESRTRRKRRPS